MMTTTRLADLLKTLPASGSVPDVAVASVADDSRKVQPGGVLVWDERIKPAATAQVLADARAKGALVVSNAAGADVVVAEPGKVLAAWAAMQHPKQPQAMLAVTGTSGKTSVAWFCQQVASAAGVEAASVGTLGTVRHGKVVDYSGYTSPTALQLHPMLEGLAADGVKLACMEVSSHALALHRADGVKFSAAGLTNVTQDHFDFHGDYDHYFAAKARLFTELLPEGATAVLNIARPESWPLAGICKQRGVHVLTVGTGNAELVVEVVNADAGGLEVKLRFDAVPVPLHLPLVGGFQAENVAVALGLLVAGGKAAGLDWAKVAKSAARLSSVPGRMEIVPGQNPSKSGQPAVIVDYAHKPDALARALMAVKPLAEKAGGKLWVVFGCGGNRDAGKRPMMGRIAAEIADVVVVTDDNPRFEDAAEIRKQVVAGVTAGGATQWSEQGDRRKAIVDTVAAAGPRDVILVAGKGHEDGQIVGNETLPFDDRVVVREVLG